MISGRGRDSWGHNDGTRGPRYDSLLAWNLTQAGCPQRAEPQ